MTRTRVIATTKDVARLAGVSPATVSYVINQAHEGTPNITPATQSRVLEAMAQLNYVPNMAGRNLRRKLTERICLALVDIGRPYDNRLVQDIQRVADQQHHSLIITTGNVPDLSEDPGGWVPEFGLQGKLLSLNHYIEADGKKMGFPADWQPLTVSRSTINGEVYGVQLHLTNMLLIYNKDMLSKAGFANPPTTWDEFLATAKATTQGSVYGFALNQDSGYAWPWFLQNGAHWYDTQKKVLVMDSPEAIEAMQFQADLIYKHKVAPIPVAAAAYEGPQKLFSAKRAAMIVTGPWDIKPITVGSPDINYGIAPALSHKVQATIAAGGSLMIPKGAKNPDMAWELLKAFTTVEVEVATAKETTVTMPRISWGNNPDIQANPGLAAFSKAFAYSKDSNIELALTGKQTAIQPLYDKMYQDVIYKNTPASDALKAFVAAGNKVLAG
jgi:multiple sugar transport system substrate-binding protein